MDGTNVKGDAAIIWRQAGREGKRDDCMQGRRETLEQVLTLERDGWRSVRNERGKS